MAVFLCSASGWMSTTPPSRTVISHQNFWSFPTLIPSSMQLIMMCNIYTYSHHFKAYKDDIWHHWENKIVHHNKSCAYAHIMRIYVNSDDGVNKIKGSLVHVKTVSLWFLWQQKARWKMHWEKEPPMCFTFLHNMPTCHCLEFRISAGQNVPCIIFIREYIYIYSAISHRESLGITFTLQKECKWKESSL